MKIRDILGKGNPTLLRLRRQPLQLLPAQGEHIGAGNARTAEKGDEALEIILLLQHLAEHGAMGGEAAGGGLGGDAAQQRPRHLAESFFVHGGNLLPDLVLLCTKRQEYARNFSRSASSPEPRR